MLDLATRQADLAIRFFRPTSNQLVAARVGQFNMSIFAAPSYIEQYGLPQKLEDLREHHIVDHTTLHSLPAMKPWSEVVERSPIVVLRTNSSYAAVEAVRVGYGISVFPDYVTKSSNLVAAPIDLRIVRDIWLVSHEETNKGARIRTVIDYVREQFRQDEREWFQHPGHAAIAQPDRRLLRQRRLQLPVDRLDLGPVAGLGLPIERHIVVGPPRHDVDVQVRHALAGGRRRWPGPGSRRRASAPSSPPWRPSAPSAPRRPARRPE